MWVLAENMFNNIKHDFQVHLICKTKCRTKNVLRCYQICNLILHRFLKCFDAALVCSYHLQRIFLNSTFRNEFRYSKLAIIKKKGECAGIIRLYLNVSRLDLIFPFVFLLMCDKCF